jgi:prevent-host-death family protein
MVDQIGAYDAKSRLPELLRRVRGGQRFTITVRGKPVADLVPSEPARPQDFIQAVEDMLNFDRVKNIDPTDVAAWIREGCR